MNESINQQEGLLWPNSLQTKVKKKKNSIYSVIFLLVVFEDLTNLKKMQTNIRFFLFFIKKLNKFLSGIIKIKVW